MPTLDPAHAAPAGEPRPGRQSGIVLGAALIGLFGGLTLWGLLDDETHEPPARASSGVAGEPDEKPDAQIVAVTPSAEVDEPPASRLLMKPLKIGALLAQQFKHRDVNGATALTSLRNVLGGDRKIVLLNVWATYCEPCKREFPGFRALQRGWADEVRFVPVQLGEDEVGPLRAVMPDAPDQLIDYMPGGAVQTALHALGLLPPKANIPVTLALDCKRNLRWFHEGEVKDMAKMSAVIEDLRQELRSPYCAVPVTPSAAAGTDEKAAGSQTQDPTPTKPAATESPCKGGCPAGQECKKQSSGGYICRRPLL